MAQRSIVCPFCPLHCDDWVADSRDADDGDAVDGPVTVVSIDSNPTRTGGGADRSPAVDCGIAAAQFAAAIDPPRPRIDAHCMDTIDWNHVLDALQLPPSPLVEFNAATIEESKTIAQWISDHHLRLTWPADPSVHAIDQTQSRDGMMAATLGEVCRHCGFIWVIGDIQSSTPRLQQRLDRTGAPTHRTTRLTLGTLSRLHHRLNDFIRARRRNEINHFVAELLPTDAADLVFQACLNQRSIAIVIGRDALEQGNEIIVSEMLQRWIANWNDAAVVIHRPPMENTTEQQNNSDDPISRVVVLRFIADQSMRAVMRWRSNQSLGSPVHPPGPAVIRVGQTDVRMPSPVQVQIGGTDPGESIARVYLPASMPGVHSAGTTVRGDGSVALPLYRWLDGVHPSRLDVLRRLLNAH